MPDAKTRSLFRLALAQARIAARFGKPPRKRPDAGDAVPAEPTPKPLPLVGGAVAPIED